MMRTLLSFANWKTSVVPYITAESGFNTFQPHLNPSDMSITGMRADLIPIEEATSNWFPQRHGIRAWCY